MMPSTSATTRWSSDGFLDSLRLCGDDRADACVAELHTSSDFATLFKQMTHNTASLLRALGRVDAPGIRV